MKLLISLILIYCSINVVSCTCGSEVISFTATGTSVTPYKFEVPDGIVAEKIYNLDFVNWF